MVDFQGKLLRRLFEERLGVDVILRVPSDDREIRCHRVVLVGASEYFERRFEGPWATSPSDGALQTLTIPELSFETLEYLIIVLYTKEFDFSDGSCSLAMAFVGADYLLMNDLKMALELWVTKNVFKVNACELLTVADKLSGFLVKALKKHNADEFARGIVPKDVGYLDYEGFCELIGVKELEPDYYTKTTPLKGNATPAVDLKFPEIDAIHLWVQSNPLERQRHVLPLLSCIRFPVGITVGYLN